MLINRYEDPWPGHRVDDAFELLCDLTDNFYEAVVASATRMANEACRPVTPDDVLAAADTVYESLPPHKWKKNE